MTKENRRSAFSFQTTKRGHRSSFPRQDLSEVCFSFASLFDEEGAGRPGARCTRSPERRKASGPVRSFQAPGDPAPFQCTGQVPQVQPGQPASLRSGVTTYFVLSPVIWLPCHRRLHKGLPLRPGSTPYAGSRTTRLGRLLQAPVVRACLDRPGPDPPLSLPPDCETASARRRLSVHRIPSRVRDAAYAPLVGRNGRINNLICGWRKSP